MNFVFNTESMGITQYSLENLGDILNYSIRNDTESIWGIRTVIQVNTEQEYAGFMCGFAIIVAEKPYSDFRGAEPYKSCLFRNGFTCYFTGDGFCTNKGGESGRGYVKALKLLEGFKIHEITLERSTLKELPLGESNRHGLVGLITKAVNNFWSDYQASQPEKSMWEYGREELGY